MSYADVADIRDFGAVSAPASSPIDCSAQIQAAIDSGKRAYLPKPPPGEVYAASSLIFTDETELFGEGDYRSSIYHLGSGPLHEIRGDRVKLSGYRVDGTASEAGSTTFLARTDLGHLDRCTIEHIFTSKSWALFKDGNHPSNRFNNLKIDHVIAAQHRGPACDFRNEEAYLEVTNSTIDYIGGSNAGNWAFQLRANRGSYWHNVDVTGGVVDASTVSNHAFFFENCVAVWMRKAFADTVGGHGFYFFGNCHAFKVTDCGSSLAGQYPVAIGASTGICSDLQFIGFGSYGRRGMAYAPPDIPGFYALNADRLRIFSGNSLNHTGPAVQTIGCTNSPNHSMNTN